MSTKEPPQTDEVVEDEELDEAEDLDVGALLESPEEQGEFQCSLPEDVAAAAEAEEEGLEPRPVQPIGASCLREFTARRDSGTRSESIIRWIVIHSTEGSSARSSAQWFANPDSQGSAHLIVDDRECYRTLDNNVIPWAAPGANKLGWHLELSGKAAFTRDQWLSRRETLRRGAFKAALHAKRFGIPIKLLSAADINAGRKGFITHALCTDVFHTAGGHTDPGRNCPLDEFMRMAKEFREDL